MKYVIYRYQKNVPIKAVSVEATTHRDKTTIEALRRHSARTEGEDNYLLITSMFDLSLLRRNGFVTGLEIIECYNTKTALKILSFDLETKTFS